VLLATSSRSFARSTLRTTIFLERRFRAHVIERDRLLFDTKFSPPAKKPSATVHIYATLRGRLQVHDGAPVDGPHAYVLADAEFDRVVAGSPTFRSSGAPAVIVELRVPAADLRRPIGLGHGPIQLPKPVWDAYANIVTAAGEPTATGDPDNEPSHALHRLMVALCEAGVLSNELSGSLVTEEPERFTRLWHVLKPLYQDYATSASLKQIAAATDLSLRQLGRDLTDLTRTFGLFGAGFRDAMRVLRLRAAVLLLSAPDATPSEVSRAVGYGSLDAMGRAFRDASLPAPSIIQDAVRYPDH
jgi:AraC-like DNA-binding protein